MRSQFRNLNCRKMGSTLDIPFTNHNDSWKSSILLLFFFFFNWMSHVTYVFFFFPLRTVYFQKTHSKDFFFFLSAQIMHLHWTTLNTNGLDHSDVGPTCTALENEIYTNGICEAHFSFKHTTCSNLNLSRWRPLSIIHRRRPLSDALINQDY